MTGNCAIIFHYAQSIVSTSKQADILVTEYCQLAEADILVELDINM